MSTLDAEGWRGNACLLCSAALTGRPSAWEGDLRASLTSLHLGFSLQHGRSRSQEVG